jgi:glycosyltransferase involved in cell wall biosynthesis
MLDLQDVISRGGKDVISRHQLYANELSKASKGNTSLKILTSRDLMDFPSEERNLFIKLESRISLPGGRILALRRFLRHNQSIKLIVVGDVFKSGLQALSSQIMLLNKIPIQYQVHADIGAKGWATFSFSHRIKYLVALLVLKNSSFVRAVSKRQALNLEKYVNNKTIIHVVPVPLNLPVTTKSDFRAHEPFVVGILGRIQSDRGLSALSEFAVEAVSKGLSIKFVCAGMEFEDSLYHRVQRQVSNVAQIENLGCLPVSRLHEFWNQVDCLLSLAPFESYGRSMREAISVGIRVISIPNAGALDLVEEVGPEWVSLWTPGNGNLAGVLIEKIKTFPKESTPPIEFDNDKSVQRLIGSWLASSC